LLGKTLALKEDGKHTDTTQNIYIEGDNLEALKLLRQNYYGEVKMIYIDPPYNTGKDFVYTDKFKVPQEESEAEEGAVSESGERLVKNEKTSNRFHARWLDMMYPRLRLAKDLLLEDGIVFISIDDNEVSNLKGICDETFGEENFIGQVAWKNKYGAGAKTRTFIEVHEYIVCYSKRPLSDLQSPLSKEAASAYKLKDGKFEIRGGYMTQPLMTNSLDDNPKWVRCDRGWISRASFCQHGFRIPKFKSIPATQISSI